MSGQSIRFYLLREYHDGTIERSYHSQTEAFQCCSNAMVNAVMEKHRTGNCSLLRVEWGLEDSEGEAQVIERHILRE